MSQVGIAFLASGAALILIVAVAAVFTRVVQRRRDPMWAAGHEWSPDPTWPVLAMTAWELCGVALGGSYWLHYLAGLLPGLSMMVAMASPGPKPRRALSLLVVYAVAASLTVWIHQVATPATVSTDAHVISYLREHARPTDGVVVGFGHPDIVAASGLESPYEHLWSLPVKVRDAELTELQEVMSGRSAPRWVVVAGDSLDTWGLEAGAAQQYLEQHYVEQVMYANWHIWHRLEARTR
jgi:hypothetical protein